METRKERAKKTRQKIIDATKVLCDQKDASKITIEDITSLAGVASGTFYIYFKRKEDVISEIAYDRFTEIIDSVMQTHQSAYERIRKFLKESIRVIMEMSLPVAQQWMKYSVAPLTGEVQGTKKLSFDTEFIKNCLTQGVEDGELAENTPVENLSLEITAEFYGIVAIWCITNGEVSPDEMMNSYCDRSLKEIIETFKVR